MPIRSSSHALARRLARTKLALAWPILVSPMLGLADYYKWEMVELPASTGASCGNGTPYRFFVNRTPLTSKTIVLFEGGGACYDKGACQYKSGFLGAINPNGVPKDYMTTLTPSLPNTVGTKIGVFNSALMGNITPFATRNNVSRVQTQSWNIVYAPYCTGDVYTGNKAAIYAEPDGSSPIVYYHRGNVNTEAMVDWLKGNMPRPEKLMVTGFSAGGVGATANYAYVRETLNPLQASMLADSGPLFNVPAGASDQAAPSAPLHRTIREAWGLDGPDGMVHRLTSRHPGISADISNLGNLNPALGQLFKVDRIGFSLTQSDKLFSAFAYDNFHPDIRAGKTIAERDALRLSKWRQEVASWVVPMQPYGNLGYYLPYARDNVLKSHTTTMLTFNNTAIPEAGLGSVVSFVDNLIDGRGQVMKVMESPQQPSTSFNDALVNWLQDQVFSALGL
jgi:hypothetical protein